MANQYRALVGFDYPAGKANVDRAKRGDLEKVTDWVRVEAGEVVDAPEKDVLASWLRNGVVEAVD